MLVVRDTWKDIVRINKRNSLLVRVKIEQLIKSGCIK
jgi:hypothetical protein